MLSLLHRCIAWSSGSTNVVDDVQCAHRNAPFEEDIHARLQAIPARKFAEKLRLRLITEIAFQC
jgi:hypothetical protein